MTSLVTLKTEGDRWKATVPVNDPVFSPLIPDLPDVSEVLLFGSVAEIIEKEWEYYLSLLNYMEYLKNQGSLQPMAMDDLLRCVTPVRHFDYRYPPLVHLHQVSRLSRLINFPENWEICVGVTEDSPEKERRDHILAMGRVMKNTSLVDADYTMYNRVPTMLRCFFCIPSLIRDSGDKVYDAYWGLARNLLIRTWNLRDGCAELDWTQMLWGDIEGLLGPQLSKDLANTWKLLSGRGEVTYTDKTRKMPGVRVRSIVSTGLTLPINHLSILYKRILDAYPEDVSPLHFGLAPIIQEEPMRYFERQNLPMMELVPQIHEKALAICSLKEDSWFSFESLSGVIIRNSQFATVVTRLSYIGSRGMRKIANCLHHYLEKEENDRAKTFLWYLEYHLEHHPELSEDFVRLPR